MEEKKPYQKPQIKEVKMVPQEAFLANCKAQSTSNPSQGRCYLKGGCGNRTIGS